MCYIKINTVTSVENSENIYAVERKYFTCPSWESNPGRWIYRQTLYHVAVKAGFYRKAVEVYYIPRPCDIHPLQFEICP